MCVDARDGARVRGRPNATVSVVRYPTPRCASSIRKPAPNCPSVSRDCWRPRWARWARTGSAPPISPASTRTGFVTLHGRADGAINRGGFKILPETVRRVLVSHPAVRDACVVGVPDARLGQVPFAAVEIVPGDATAHC